MRGGEVSTVTIALMGIGVLIALLAPEGSKLQMTGWVVMVLGVEHLMIFDTEWSHWWWAVLGAILGPPAAFFALSIVVEQGRGKR